MLQHAQFVVLKIYSTHLKTFCGPRHQARWKNWWGDLTVSLYAPFVILTFFLSFLSVHNATHSTLQRTIAAFSCVSCYFRVGRTHPYVIPSFSVMSTRRQVSSRRKPRKLRHSRNSLSCPCGWQELMAESWFIFFCERSSASFGAPLRGPSQLNFSTIE